MAPTGLREPPPGTGACRLRGNGFRRLKGEASLLVCLDPAHQRRIGKECGSGLVPVFCPLQALECLNRDPRRVVILDRCPARLPCCRRPLSELQARIRVANQAIPVDRKGRRPSVPPGSGLGPDLPSAERIRGTLLGLVGDLRRDLTLQDLSRLFGVSARHLHRRFLEAGCASPMKELRHLQLLGAYHEIAHSTRSISSIAEEMPYADPSSFTRAFRRAFGFYPGKLRSSSH